MIAAILLALLTIDAQPLDAAAQAKPAATKPAAKPGGKSKVAEIKAQFEELFTKDDRAGCLALWKENPQFVLRTIDADLEGSMRVYEATGEPDMKKIEMMHKRALWGAEIAVEVNGQPIILDYASSFVGWTKEQRGYFRVGQAVYKKAMDAQEKADHKLTLEAGRECVDRASALGDWWGAAMGYEAMGLGQQGLSDFENALVSFSRARILNHDLGLFGDEYTNLRSMIDMCYTLERWSRGLATTNEALATARKMENKEAIVEFLKRRATFQEKLGDKTAADTSRKEADGLK